MLDSARIMHVQIGQEAVRVYGMWERMSRTEEYLHGTGRHRTGTSTSLSLERACHVEVHSVAQPALPPKGEVLT